MRALVLAAVIVAAATPALPQERQCGPTEHVFRALTELHFEEIVGQARAAAGIVHLFVNRVTGTWTLVATRGGRTCLLAHGTDWEAVDLPPAGNG